MANFKAYLCARNMRFADNPTGTPPHWLFKGPENFISYTRHPNLNKSSGVKIK